jgi:glycosyltransferase involved in cell wall biosynthesis
MTARASVVIPAYNHGRFISEAVDSVLASPVEDWQLVVVDDGSTDDTLDRLDSYRSDGRVEIYSQPNRGAHVALNRGIELARGDIVFILNSDDAYLPGRIPAFLEHFEAEPELVLLGSWLEVVDADGASLGVKRGWANMPPWPPPTAGPFLSELGALDLALLEGNFVATTSNAAFRRRLIDRGLRFAALRYCHDWDFMLTACDHGSFELIDEPLVRYRVHGDNTIREGMAAGEAQMRFEVMWVVCRHAWRRGAAHIGDLLDIDELTKRIWRSLPRFGRDDLLGQLLALRGDQPEPPSAYDALLDPDHPFRCAAIDALSDD